jgi:hypothetical protein
VTLPDWVCGPQRLAQQTALIFRAAMTLQDKGTLFFETFVTTHPAIQCDTPGDPIPNLTLISISSLLFQLMHFTTL